MDKKLFDIMNKNLDRGDHKLYHDSVNNVAIAQ